MRYVLKTAPTAEPLLKAAVKPALGIAADNTAHDDLIGSLLDAARERIESWANEYMVDQQWYIYVEKDRLPVNDKINLRIRPITSIDAIDYSEDDEVTWTSSSTDNYRLMEGDMAAPVIPVTGASWPYGIIRFTVSVGYGTVSEGVVSGVPERYITAMRRLVAHWFEQSAGSVPSNSAGAGVDVYDLPPDVVALISADRDIRIC